ncbi:hypothetical protein [Pseudoclavibacter helvolus]|uniref:hypothetical protein n=1 Tax=Pseudoclavibacter helvolus TaxID=255205 RepID=UPI0024AC8351|nr:hypothetical protein [Pseudoclavibacter helvolus]
MRIWMDYGTFYVHLGEWTGTNAHDDVSTFEFTTRGELMEWNPHGTITVSSGMRMGELTVNVSVTADSPAPAVLLEDQELDEITVRPTGRRISLTGFTDGYDVDAELPESTSGLYRVRLVATGRAMDLEEPDERFDFLIWPVTSEEPRELRQLKMLS